MSDSIRIYADTVAEREVMAIDSPFAAKDALAATGLVQWDRHKRRWFAERSALGLMQIRKALSDVGWHTHIDTERPLRGLECPWGWKGATEHGRRNDGSHWPTVHPPRDYQQDAVHAISRMAGVILAWDMGTGKTKAVIDAIIATEAKRVLVVCPKSVVSVWADQVAEHRPTSHLHSLVALPLDRGSIAKRSTQLKRALEAQRDQGHALIVAINYEAAHLGGLGKLIPTIDWDMAVADESHRIMNPQAKVTKAMATKIRPRAKKRVCLTGTPFANHPGDIFAQAMFADPGVFGTSWWRFKGRYLDTIEHPYPKILGVKPDKRAEFDGKLGWIMNRIKIADVLTLPDKVVNTVTVPLTAETAKVYEALRSEMVAEIEQGEITVDNALGKMLRLQQICNGVGVVKSDDPAEPDNTYDIGSEKLDAAREIIDGIDRSEPVVIFAQFTRDIERLREAVTAAGRESYVLRGGRNEREQWAEACDSGKGAVLIVQRRAGGVGIDLTRSHYCIDYSPTFSSIDWRQSRARQLRHGQRHSVVYYHLLADPGIDRYMMRALETKEKMSTDAMDGIAPGKADIAHDVMAAMVADDDADHH